MPHAGCLNQCWQEVINRICVCCNLHRHTCACMAARRVRMACRCSCCSSCSCCCAASGCVCGWCATESGTPGVHDRDEQLVLGCGRC